MRTRTDRATEADRSACGIGREAKAAKRTVALPVVNVEGPENSFWLRRLRVKKATRGQQQAVPRQQSSERKGD